jgi:hypothetical protein
LKVNKIAIALTCLTTTLVTSNGVHAASIEFTNSNTSVNSAYDRTGAVNFIKQYAATPGYQISPYTTYGGISLGGDCTNFASQTLHIGGGLPFRGTKGSNSNTVDWYYYGPNVPPATNPRTSSWTGAHEFRQHWGVVNSTGGKFAYEMRKYTKAEAPSYYDEIYSALEKGDMVQYVRADGVTTHTQIVWNYANKTMNVAQHSDDGGYWGLDMGLKTQLDTRKDEGGWVIVLRIKAGQ